MVTGMHRFLAARYFFCEVYPMGAKSDAGFMLNKFVRRYEAPKPLIFEGSKE